jgi:hypothetical protein
MTYPPTSRARTARHRTDYARPTVHEDTPPSLKTAVIEEALPCSYLFELQYATLKANGHGVSSIIGLELSDDVPYMEIDRRFGNS